MRKPTLNVQTDSIRAKVFVWAVYCNFSANHKNYNFLACDWFKNVLFSTNSLAKLLSDSLLLDILLLDSLLSDSSISQSHTLAFVVLAVTFECLCLFCQYFNANFLLFS